MRDLDSVALVSPRATIGGETPSTRPAPSTSPAPVPVPAPASGGREVPTGLRRAAFLRWVLVAVAAVATTAKVVVPDSPLATISFLGTGALGAAVALLGARGGAAARRRARLWIAAGLALSSLGDFTFQILSWLHATADVTVADIPWLACYAALAVGLHGLLVGPSSGRRRIDLDAFIDMALAAVAAVLILWETALRALVADTSVTVWVRTVWAAYPVLDCVLLVLLVRTMTSRQSRTSVGVCLIAGASLWLAADFGFLATGGGSWVAAMDIGWLLGVALLAIATLRPDPPEAEALAAPDQPSRLSGWRLLLGMTPLLIPGVLDAVAHHQGRDESPVQLLGATIVLVLLTSARGLRLVRSVARAQARAEASEHYFRSLALNSSDAVLVLDASGTVVKDLHNLGSLAGVLRAPVQRGHELQLGDVAVPADPEACRALFDRALLEPGRAIGTPLAFVHVDGSERWVAARMVNLLHDPHVEGVVINLHDITAHKQAQDDLEHLALHDALTGLANRTLLGERLEQALLRSDGTGSSPAVLFLDLDNFKTVNDSLGHDMGDLVLVEVARRIETAVRQTDTVSRLGGDEFAVLIEENHFGIDEAGTTAERLQQAMVAPIAVGTHLLSISASIGIAAADQGATASSLLRDADVAMYRAKASGRAQSTAFETAMGAEARDRLELEADLALALDLDQFEIVYQPVIELENDGLVGFEALLRWNHPERGTVMPDQFIPIAEETGAIVAIGRWVIDTACQQVADWERDLAAGGSVTLAVNLSAHQLACRDIVDHVTSALEASGLAPSSLVLEMTETALIRDPETASVRLQELRSLGVKLAIDDFGTGYSSLSYLRQFPIDILKIDRSFVETIRDHADLPAIVRGLLDLGRTLGLDVVAEGVELGVQRDWLKSEQCKFGQGYLFARPLTAADARRQIVDRIVDAAVGSAPSMAR